MKEAVQLVKFRHGLLSPSVERFLFTIRESFRRIPQFGFGHQNVITNFPFLSN